MGVIPARSINFFVYGNGKRLVADNFNSGAENSWVHLSAAALAGIVTGTATNPIWVVKTRLQLESSGRGEIGEGRRKQFGGSWDCIKKIMREEGPRGFYKGLSASYLGVTEGTIQWVLYERFKKFNSEAQGPGDVNAIGHWAGLLGSAGAAKMIASLITYPHEVRYCIFRSGFILTIKQVLRTRLRQPSVNGVVKYTGLWQTLRLVIKEEGARSLYGGLSAHLMRVVPNAAVMYAIYESLIRWA